MEPFYFIFQQDSLYVVLDDIANNTSSLVTWQNLISAALGGFLVVFGHYLIERVKISKENHKELVNTLSKLSEIKYLLRNLFRELALYKTHARYWWFCTIKEKGAEAKNHRQEHLRSQEEARQIEKQIGTNIANFLGQITKFKILSNEEIDVSKWIEEINEIKFEKAREYSEKMDYDNVKNQLVEKDEKNLKKNYFKNLSSFEKIIFILNEKL